MSEPEEMQRLAALHKYAILDTPPEAEFDKVTQLAASICDVPIAVVTLVDEHRQWFKSAVGLNLRETDRAVAFCAVGIQQPGPMVVSNALQDGRFSQNPLVVGDPGIRFYACFPLVSSEGFALGTLAVIDRVPRTLTPSQLSALGALAEQVMLQLELRRQRMVLRELNEEREQMLATLQQHAEILRIAGQLAHIGGWIADLGQGTVMWSPEVAAIHEVDAVTLPFATARDFYAAPWREHLVRCFRACAKEGRPFDEEMQIITAQGKRVWVRTIGQPMRDGDGRITRIKGALQDISELKLAESQLSQSRRRFREMADAMPQIVWTATPDGTVDYANRAMFEYEGMARKGSAEVEWLSALHPDDVEATRKAWAGAVQSGQPLSIEYRLRRKGDTQFRWMLVQAQPARGDDGAIVEWYGTVTDNHDRKRAEDAIRISEERFKNVARATADAVWDWDLVTGKVWRNEGFQKLYGYRTDEIEEGFVSWSGRLHPQDRERVLAGIHAVIQGTAQYWEDQFRFRRADGSYAYAEDRGFVIRDAAGAAVRMVGGMTDISEKRLAEEAAQREEHARARIIQTQQEIASANLDPQDLMTLLAERARELVGATGGEVELLDGDALICAAATGTTTRSIGMRFPRTGSLSGLALQTGETLCCDDAETDTRVNGAICREVGVRSVLVAPLRVGDAAIGTVKVSAPPSHAFGKREIAHLQILTESMGVVIQRQRIAAELATSEAQYRMLFHNNPLPMWVYETTGLRLLAANRSAVDEYGYSVEEFLQLTVRDLWAPGHLDEYTRSLAAIPLNQKTFGLRRRHRRKNGEIIDVEIAGDAMVFAGQPARLVLVNNVTQRLRAERELARVSRAQAMLSACNESLIRAEHEQLLLEKICSITVEIGGYCMAWVGFANDDARQSITPAAFAGAEKGYLARLELSWSPQTPAGRGAVGRAVASGQIVVVEDVTVDASVRPWRDIALAHGFRASVSLPLRDDERVFGVLVLYASEVTQVPREELALLEELANDLAFGIKNLRARAEQRRLQASLLKVATAVSSHSGAAFFDQLVQHMVEAVDAQGGFVALLEADGAAARTIAGVLGGLPVPEFGFTLAGTPCEALVRDGISIVRDAHALKFPDVPALASAGAQSWVGRRLDDADGAPLGLLFVLFSHPLKETDSIVSTLLIFASRAAGELQRLQTDARLRDQASLLDRAQDAIIVRNIEHGILYWNRSAERLYGWSAQEAQGQSIDRLLYEDTAAFLLATQHVLQDGEWTGEIEQRRKDGSRLTVEGRWTLVRDDAGRPKSILAINTDIGERKKAEMAVHRLAFYDSLTGLPNRMLLMDRLHQALAGCVRNRTRGALLFIDLDNFKTLNDTLGHEKGDELLVQVSRQLMACVRETDTVARLGGDEFLVMLEDLSADADEAQAQTLAVAEKVLAVLSQPYQLDNYEHSCTSSIGIAPFADRALTAGELLKRADLAMYQAKAAGRNALRLYDPQMQIAVSSRATLETDLRDALAQRQFVLHYQPQSDMQGRLVGVEALVRWRHPNRGMVSPAQFIPLAEETGLILPLGHWVLETACACLADGMAGLLGGTLAVSVNVSARQFHHPEFVDQVLAALAKTGAPAHRLKLELTESLLAADMESIVRKMTLLRQHGVGFSLDDFGTGYSSLAYLKRLPLDQLKIDQSFVRDVLTNTNDAVIARTIVALGANLDLDVIAEGVETQAQKEFLTNCGCHGYQGYLLSPPMPEEQLLEFVRAYLP